MNLSKEQLIALSEKAIEAGKKAAQLIAEYSRKDVKVERKDGGESLAAQVVTEVDRLSQDLLLEELRPTIKKYDLGLLTEESEDDQSRLEKDYFWCIDPLDGTLPFTEKREGYSVSIALVAKNGVPQIGVVVHPTDQSVYHAIKGEGAFKNGRSIKKDDLSSSLDTFSLVVDGTILKHEHFEKVREALEDKAKEWGFQNLELMGNGGAAMNAIWVLENAPACFFKFPKKAKGGGSLWDYAATACIFNELGAIANDIKGRSLNLNKKSVFMNECGVVYCIDQHVLEFVTNLHKQLMAD